MIRILHTSDWHLGKKFERYTRHEEQKEVLSEICEIADKENVDVILIAGDLFDTSNPPAESQELFYRTLKRLSHNGKRAVVAIAGNHDMPERIEAPDPLARECGIVLTGFPKSVVPLFSLEDGFTLNKSDEGFIELQLPGKPSLRVILTPYANEATLRAAMLDENPDEELRNLLKNHWQQLSDKYCDTAGINILLAHLLFMNDGDDTPPEEPDDERPINHIGGAPALFTGSIPSTIQYVALGHLHRKQSVSLKPCPVVYSGSPLSYSFSEASQQKNVVIVDLEPGKEAAIKTIPLQSGKTLERVRFEELELALEWLQEHPDTLVELTIVSDTYLSGDDRRRLQEVHKGIVAIIPEIRNPLTEESATSTMRNDRNIREMFADFFKHRKGQAPDQAILGLFDEIIGKEEIA